MKTIKNALAKLPQTMQADGIGSNSRPNYNRKTGEYELLNSQGRAVKSGSKEYILDCIERLLED